MYIFMWKDFTKIRTSVYPESFNKVSLRIWFLFYNLNYIPLCSHNSNNKERLGRWVTKYTFNQ